MLIDIYLIVLISFCIICFIVMLILGNRKIYTFETINFNEEIPDMSNGQPIVYELIYISNDQSTGIWQFSKNQDIKNDIGIAIKHFKDKKINYLIIKNNLFKIETIVKDTSTTCELLLSNLCQTNLSFTNNQCQSSTSITNSAFHVLHVLGYNF